MNSVGNGMLLPHTPDGCPVSPSKIKTEKLSEMDKRYENLASAPNAVFKGMLYMESSLSEIINQSKFSYIIYFISNF